MGGKLIRRTSPSSRIIGGNPADRCKSEAPCLAEKASNSVVSMVNPNREQQSNRESVIISAPHRPAVMPHQRQRASTFRSTQVSAGCCLSALSGSLLAVPCQHERPETI